MAIWWYGHMAIIWPYGHKAILPYGFKGGLYGCLWKQQYKCSNLVKTRRWLDLPARNESKNGLIAFFPLYFFGSSFVNTKIAGTSRILLETWRNFFCGFIMPSNMYSQLRRTKFTLLCILTHPSLNLLVLQTDLILVNYKF